MAITATGTNPIIVTGTTASKDDIKASGQWHITGITWLQPTTQGHKVAIQDGNGKELYEFYCQTANSSQSEKFEKSPLQAFDGIYSDDMDSGTLYVFIK